LLVEGRRIAALGADVASIDYGQSTDFMVHRIAAAAGAPGLENLTNLDQLPPTGAVVIALPMKIGGGSGGPAWVVAVIQQD
jgi:kynurenine formamidase